MMKKVLVIDDSATIRKLVSLALTASGFEVLEAIDGIAGAEAIAAHPDIAAVLCDVNMPRMNGIDMLEQVKRLPANAKLPIIMLTTEGQSSLMRRAKAAGALGWIVKPIEPGQLAAVVKRAAA